MNNLSRAIAALQGSLVNTAIGGSSAGDPSAGGIFFVVIAAVMVAVFITLVMRSGGKGR